MKIKTQKIIGTGIGVFAAIVILAITLAGSWIMTCGIIKLITMCFGWTFNWGVATGVWLIMLLAKQVFKPIVNTKK